MSNKPTIVKFTGPNPSIEVIPIGHFTDNLVNDVTFEFNRYIGDIDLAQFYCMLHIENLGATLLQTKVSDSKLQAVLTVTTDITNFPGTYTSSIKFVRDTGNLQYVWTTRNFDLIVERRVDLDTEIQHIDPTPLAGFIINLAANTARINDLEESKLNKPQEIQAGTFPKITINQYGLVTEGHDLSSEDIPPIPISRVSGLTDELEDRIETFAEEIDSKLADKADLVDGKVPLEQLPSYSYDEIIDKPVSVMFEITSFTELTPLQKTTITNQLMPLLNDNLTDLDTNKYSDLILKYLDERYHYSSVVVIDGEVVRILFDYKNEDTKIKLDINFVGDDSQTVIELVTINYELEGTVSTHNASETAHPFLIGKIDEARAIAEGKVSAMSFETKALLDAWLEIPENVETLLVGTNFYIEDLASPDYWWNGTTIVELSTDKIDLTEYAKKTELLTLGTTSDNAYRGDLGQTAYEHSQSTHAPTNAQKNVQVNWTEDDADSDAFILNKPTDIILEVSSNDYSSLTPEEKTEIKNIILSLIDETTGNIDNLKYDDIILSNGNVRNHYTSIHESELIVSIIFFMTLQDDEIYHNYRIEISIPKGAGTTTLEKTKIITSQDITKTEIEEKLTGEISSHSHALPTHNHTKSEITDFPTIPTIPDVIVNNGSAESGKYISQIAVDATDKHKLIVTKVDLPQGFSGKFGDLTEVPDEFTPSEHNHDDRYYTETEVDTKLGGKANATHTHTRSEITDFPTSIPPTAHTHTRSEITDFPIIPTVPTISNNIAEDAENTSKTTSPKAVKDYVDTVVGDLAAALMAIVGV